LEDLSVEWNTEIDFKMAGVDWIYLARIMTSGGLL